MPVSLTPQRKRSRFFFRRPHSAHGDGRREAAQIRRFAWTNLQQKRQKNKSDQRLDVKCRSGQVVFVLERTLVRTWSLLREVGEHWLVWSSDFSRPLSVVASKSRTKADPSSLFQLHTVTVNSSTLIKIRPQRQFSIFDFSPEFFLQSFRRQ
jgi:hypothetical protein